jgi:hypothetical protein
MSVNVLALEQTKAKTESVGGTSNCLTIATHFCMPHYAIMYHVSYMIINIHSGASYPSEIKANIRSGGSFYMVSNIDKPNRLTNGAVSIISMVLKHGMSSAAEAEIGSVFINAKEGTVLHTTLEEMGHPQQPTPLETDNTTLTG